MSVRQCVEYLFDLFYLLAIFLLSVLLLLAAGGGAAILFGVMGLVLGLGDLFHLLPRMRHLRTGKEPFRALGFGKLATSVTSAVYYLLLFYAWTSMVGYSFPLLTASMWCLTILRILLCCLPQNQWSRKVVFSWSLLRNIPFLLMGILVASAFLFIPAGDSFRLLPLAVLLSFACYLPVALFARKKPMLGILMMPKTLLYVWVQLMAIEAFL